MRQNVQNKDTTSPLFDIPYEVDIPYAATINEVEVNLFGTVSTGDRKLDEDLAKQWVRTFRPIHILAELYDEGHRIKIIHYNDLKKIYEDITEHLEYWKYNINYGINVGNAPIDDLMKLDRLANDIYGNINQHYGSGNFSRMLFKDFFQPGTGVLDSLFKPENKQSDKEQLIENKKTAPERESLGDFLNNSMVKSTRFKGR